MAKTTRAGKGSALTHAEMDANINAIPEILDEDNMASNSATKVPSQQSVKAYVDANAGSGGSGGVDWTVDQGSTNIHAGNYTDTNTTYSVGDGGLTEKNFTGTLKTKLDGVAASANNYSLPVASGTVSGGIKVGANLTMTNGVLAATGGSGGGSGVDWTVDQGATDIHAGNYTNTTYSVGDGGLTEKNFTSTLKTKLDGVEASATADQTGAEIKTAYEGEANTNAYTDAEKTKLSGIADSANNYSLPVASGSTSGGIKVGANLTMTNGVLAATDTNTTYSVGDGGLTEKNFTSTLKTKLDGVEASATADQTGAEIKTAYEGEANTNAYTDAEKTKLSGIADSANNYSLPVASGSTSGGIKVGANLTMTNGVLAATDTNTTYSVGDGGLTEKNFTGTLKTKLDGVEASATADQTGAEIKTAYEGEANTNAYTDAEKTKLSGIADSANNYSLPVASGSTSGGIKVGANLTMTNGVLAATDTNTTYSVGDGGLTEKNFTGTLKTKLDGVATSANNYSLPVASGSTSGGVKVGTNLSISNGVLSSTDTNTTYSVGDAGLTEKNFTGTLKTKLDGVATSANNYSLPVASGSTSGGVKVGTNLSISNGVLSSTDTNTTYSVGDGGLTEKNFTGTLKTKLDGVAASANNYSLPVASGTVSGGVKVGTNLSISNGVLSSTDTNTTYSVGDGGLTEKNFTGTLKTKLDGIATSANNYSHPTSAGNKHIPSGGATDQVLTYSASGTAVWADAAGGGGLESGTTMMFYQASAPTGWTQDTTASLDGRALRVETGQGGGSGGTHDLANPPSTSHSHSTPSHSHSHTLSAGSHTLTTSQMPSHNHSTNIWNQISDNWESTGNRVRMNQGSAGSKAPNWSTASTGGSTSHAHNLSGSISNSAAANTGSSGATAFAPKYVNVIICSKV